MNEGTYQKPSHGWTCFHCGETFTTTGAARDHFGFDPSSEPGCRIKAGAERGLLMALRKAEQELAAYRNDDTSLTRYWAGVQSRHADALRDAEQLGFDRGVAEMRKHGWRTNEERDRPDLYTTSASQ